MNVPVEELLRAVMCLGSFGSVTTAKFAPKGASRGLLGALVLSALLTIFLGGMWAQSPVRLGGGG